MGQLADIFKQAALGNLELLRKDIETATPEVWEKKFGGDYYWDQILHGVGSAGLFLSLLGAQGVPQAPQGASVNLRQEADPSKPHGKDIAIAYLEENIRFLNEFFENFDDAALSKPAHFFGRETTGGGILAFLATHLAYHVGACDIILRENGLPGAL
jgi:hypothetical protein